MTTRECFLWLQKRRSQLGIIERPKIARAELFREEKSRREAIGLRLFHDKGFGKSSDEPLDQVELYLLSQRLAFSERLVLTLMLPYSPCRVRNWYRERNLHWLLIISWTFVGVGEWHKMEMSLEYKQKDYFAE